MAKAHILILVTWTLLLAVGVCDTADTCARPRDDDAENIRSLESKMDKKLTQLQAALDSLAKQTADLTSKVTHLATQGNLTRDDLTAELDWPDFCGTCEKVIKAIYDLLDQGDTLEHALEKVCSIFPWPVSTACQSFVEKYGGELLPLLEQALPPSTVCKTLGLCSRLSNLTSKVTHLASQGNLTRDDLTADLDWPDFCGTCEKVIKAIYDLLDQGDTLEHALEKVCSIFPWPVSTACQSFVEKYGGELLPLLEQALPPSTVCKTLGLCSRLSSTVHAAPSAEVELEVDSRCCPGGCCPPCPPYCPHLAEVKLERGSCPEFWYNHAGRCYKYVASPMSWPEAELNCVGQDANLVSINSQGEQDFVQYLIKNFDPRQRDTWIGLSDTQWEDYWMWSDGSRVNFTMWYGGPPGGGTSQNCVYTFGAPSKWNDYECYETNPSVCALRTVCP